MKPKDIAKLTFTTIVKTFVYMVVAVISAIAFGLALNLKADTFVDVAIIPIIIVSLITITLYITDGVPVISQLIKNMRGEKCSK